MSTRSGSLFRHLLPLGAAVILTTAPLAAQEPEPEDRDCVCIHDLRSPPALRAFATVRRAMLGVALGEPIEVGGRHGISLQDVRDGSPAGRAGLRGGDVVVALDGRDLGEDPAAGLLDIMRHVEPGDTVTVTYVRGGDERTARVVTAPASLFTFGDGDRFRMRVPGAHRPAVAPLARAPRAAESARAARGEMREMMREMGRPAMLYRHLLVDGLELTAVNPELGAYFGTDRGVLVADIDADSPLGLRPGDVILAIDGRDVEDAAHVRAILASYRDGEEISFRIVREQRTREVAGRRP